MGGDDWCYCGRVKQTKEPFPTDTYCHCSTGWYKSLFEAAFDKPVKVKLKQSILQGADSCEFEIEFGENLGSRPPTQSGTEMGSDLNY